MAMPQLLGYQLLGGPQLLGPQLLGLGDGGDSIDTFLTLHPGPSSTEVINYLKSFEGADRAAQAQALLARGVDARTISTALSWFDVSQKARGAWPTIAGVLALASFGASVYHGYKRNNSVGWAVWWGFMGALFPVITPVIAVAQGFGKRKAA